MKAKVLIELLQHLDGDTEIATYAAESVLTKNITLWDWRDTHDVVVLIGIEKQDWVDMNLTYTEDPE